jgi:hypothetical protein
MVAREMFTYKDIPLTHIAPLAVPDEFVLPGITGRTQLNITLIVEGFVTNATVFYHDNSFVAGAALCPKVAPHSGVTALLYSSGLPGGCGGSTSLCFFFLGLFHATLRHPGLAQERT